MDDFDHAAAVLDGIAEEVAHVDDATLSQVGHFALNMILLRTKQGKDADLVAFKPYTPEYAQVRQKRGLSTRPDLAVTGHMLGSMTVRVAGGEASIVVNNPLEATKLAANNDGTTSNPGRKRELFDIRHPTELQAVAEVLGGGMIANIEKRVK